MFPQLWLVLWPALRNEDKVKVHSNTTTKKGMPQIILVPITALPKLAEQCLEN